MVVCEGMNVIDGDLLETCTSNLSGYEDVLPEFNEFDSAIRFIHAEDIIEKTASFHTHRTPSDAFYFEYYGRDACWKDYMSAKRLFASVKKLDVNLWMTEKEMRFRKLHPYFDLVKRFREWEHKKRHPKCACTQRPHVSGTSFISF